MKNMYGEEVKPQYEIAFQRHVEGSAEDDFESIDYTLASNYRDAVRKAKELSLSKKYSDTKEWRISICCYFQDDTSSYNLVWQEYYINGKKNYRYEY